MTRADFHTAGRELGAVQLALSERNSAHSTWLLFALPAAIMSAGLVEAWAGIGAFVGIVLTWRFVAEPLRAQSRALNCICLTQFFAAKFEGQAHRLGLVVPSVICFFYAFYLAAQLKALGGLAHATWGVNPKMAMIGCAFTVSVYVIAGGLRGVVGLDVLQTSFIGLLLALLLFMGLGDLQSRGINLVQGILAYEDLSSVTASYEGWAAVSAVLAGLSIGLGYCGQPHILSRFMAARDGVQLKRAGTIAVTWAALSLFSGVTLGLIGIVTYDIMSLIPHGSSSISLIPHMVQSLLPARVAGLVLCGLIFVLMGPVASQLLVLSSIFGDLGFGGTHEVRKSRTAVALFGAGGFLLALASDRLVLTLAAQAWLGLGAALGPALLCTLYLPKIRGRAVTWGILVGALSAIVWPNLGHIGLSVQENLNAGLLAFVLSAGTILMTSLIPPRS